MAHLTRPAEISGVSAGLFPETAAGNRAYLNPCFIFKTDLLLWVINCSPKACRSVP